MKKNADKNMQHASLFHYSGEIQCPFNQTTVFLVFSIGVNNTWILLVLLSVLCKVKRNSRYMLQYRII